MGSDQKEPMAIQQLMVLLFKVKDTRLFPTDLVIEALQDWSLEITQSTEKFLVQVVQGVITDKLDKVEETPDEADTDDIVVDTKEGSDSDGAVTENQNEINPQNILHIGNALMFLNLHVNKFKEKVQNKTCLDLLRKAESAHTNFCQTTMEDEDNLVDLRVEDIVDRLQKSDVRRIRAP